MPRLLRHLWVVCIAAQGLLQAPDALAEAFRDGASYDFTIPAPASILGVEIGERPLRHEEILRYFEALAAASPRMKLEEYGRTHEGRRLVLGIISAADNIRRLDAIQEAMAHIGDPRETSRAEVDNLSADTPAIAWLAYSIHGDELSGADAGVRLAYELCAGTDKDVGRVLDEVVTIIDPLQNPDGRTRYLAQLTHLQGAVPNPDPSSLQHTAFWPWGRGNHYLFDLNRDWFIQVHPESRGKVAAIRRWNPQLLVDGHEMGSADTYLFSPPREPFNPHMTDELLQWWEVYADDQARAFDRHGWSYYTREWNEEWFPGYGSSWAVYLGAVGILYEQSRTTGSLVKRPDGSVLTFRGAVHRQLTSSFANLATTARHKRELILSWWDQRREAVRSAGHGPLKAFVLAPRGKGERVDRLAWTLENQGIEVYRADAPIEVRELHDPWGETHGKKTLPAGTRLVRLDQPLAPLALVTMEFHAQMPDSFLVTEREHLERNKGTRLYESTGWSVPLAYGVEAYWTGKMPGGRWERDTILADFPERWPARSGTVQGAPGYGYVADGSQENIPAAAGRLLAGRLSVRAAREGFRSGGHDYPPGTLLLRRIANPDSLATVVQRVAKETGVDFVALPSARVERGPDLGGGRYPELEAPRIALVAGNPINFSEYGALWHLFDRELGLRVSSLDIARLANANLHRYNVLVLPPAWGVDGYRRALGEGGLRRVRDWVEEGGTLIGYGAAASYLADSTAAMSAVRQRRQALEDFPPVERGVTLAAAEALRLPNALGESAEEPAGATVDFGIPGEGEPVLGPGALALAGEAGRRAGKNTKREEEDSDEDAAKPEKDELERIDRRLRTFMPRGPILRVDLDTDHWLAWGATNPVGASIYTSHAYLARSPVRTVGRLAAYEQLHVSGLLWPEAAGRWARTAYLTREGKGRGQIILFAGSPVFRGYWLATHRLLLNAAILGPGLGASAPPEW